MEAASASETPVTICQSARRPTPEDLTLPQHLYENISYHVHVNMASEAKADKDLPFSAFINLLCRYFVGLVGKGSSTSQAAAYKNNTNTEKMETYAHALSGIRNHDPPSVRSIKDSTAFNSADSEMGFALNRKLETHL